MRYMYVFEFDGGKKHRQRDPLNIALPGALASVFVIVRYVGITSPRGGKQPDTRRDLRDGGLQSLPAA